MKIRRVTDENLAKAVALLQAAFPDSPYEAQLVQELHAHGKTIHDWVCIHTNKLIAYVAFTPAYRGKEVCGLHLAPLAVNPEFQKQGVGSELLRFALTQEPVKGMTVFVLGRPAFYQRFGFTPCSTPICPFAKNNAHFLGLGNHESEPFPVGYEAEFTTNLPPRQPPKKKARARKAKR
jgi:putative acetyltransferase